MRFPKLLGHRAGPAGRTPTSDDGDDTDDWEHVPGGYLITTRPDAPLTTLSEPISTRSETLPATIPPHQPAPSTLYLLGGPGQPTCEVVLVEPDEPPPGEPRRLRRGRCGTVVSAHPAGTPVTPVIATHVEDWAQWAPQDIPTDAGRHDGTASAEAASPDPGPDHAGAPPDRTGHRPG